MVRVKVCGITQPEQAGAICELGADALGMVFYGPSPRNVTIEQAQQISRSVLPYVSRVGLFVDTPVDEINRIAEACDLDTIQFHGNQTPVECAQANRKWYKAMRVGDARMFAEQLTDWQGQPSLLLDAYVKGLPGGTGQRFDWGLIPAERPWKLILAGGLTAENVADAIRQTQPYAVDVSGGVESAPGVKDLDQVEQFISEVRA